MVLMCLSTLAVVNDTQANELRCGDFEQNFGPFDYRVAPGDKKRLVERVHFTREVETLKKGSSGYLGSDISYTLIVFPNHSRALRSMMDLEFKAKSAHPPGARYPVWCYFDRAVRFKPEDPQVRMVYGIYLQRKGNHKGAVQHLLVAEQFSGENANLLYNIGLLYLDLGDFEKALKYAHRAYATGFPLEGLRKRLKRAGKWTEQVPPPATADIGQTEPHHDSKIADEDLSKE